DRLHSLAIHLLGSLRSSDAETEISPARLSALTVLVFHGRVPPGELATIEGCRYDCPTPPPRATTA
ncbi:MAG: hypothetical protein ABIS03_08415, partial [Gemmatimonadaceae bacterium]